MPLDPTTETVHTPAQVARLLNEKEWRVRELIRCGRLRAKRMGGSEQYPRKLRVTDEALREYLVGLPDYRPRAAAFA